MARNVKRAVSTNYLGTSNESLAGQRVKQGDFTVEYNERGRAVSQVRDGGRSATSFVPTTHKDESPTHQAMYEAAKNGDWDKVGLLSHDLLTPTDRRDEAGNVVYDTTAADTYVQELGDEFGYNFNDYVGKKYDSTYGAGAYDGGTGTGQPVFNELSKKLVDQHRAAQGGAAQPGTPAVQQSGTGGYGDFDSFLSAMGYDSYAEETQRAIQAAVQKAVGDLNQQIVDTEEQSEELARQAYIAHMLGQKNLDQQLSANGYAGGMADSQRIAMEASYQNDLNELNRQKEATIRELQSAITNAQLTGDMQTAQELSGFLQNIQGQWNNYVMTQQAMDNQNYWNQQNMNAEQQATSRALALAMIEQGRMPDAATLTAAGMTAEQAQILLGTAGSGVPGVTPVRTGGGYDNQGIDPEDIKVLQYAIGATPDGLWGEESKRLAKLAGLPENAAEAWAEALLELEGTQQIGTADDIWKRADNYTFKGNYKESAPATKPNTTGKSPFLKYIEEHGLL